MALFSLSGIKMVGVACAVPSRTVDNLDLDLIDGERESFVARVGIRSRRIAPPNICASDLCVAAASRLLEDGRYPRDSIGALLFVTQTPDFPLPGNSLLVHQRLGLPVSTLSLDLSQGCAGYVYGLATLSAIMSAAQIARGLLLVGDTISRVISPEDKSTTPIFSDAGSATLLERSTSAAPMWFNFGADGQGASAISIQDGGSRNPFRRQSVDAKQTGTGGRRAPVHLAMEGVDVLQYCFRYVVPNILELLAGVGTTVDAPDFYIFHQANRLLNDGLARKLKLDPKKTPESLFDFGNTSSATIPVTLTHRLRNSLAAGKNTMILSGFGAGFSWGSALVTTDSMVCPAMIELS
jgi:3-oxoacyl-[acyl-carrier-protein] synthase-3